MKLAKWGLAVALAGAAISVVACGGSSGGPSTNGNDDLFTTAGFEKAYNAVLDKAGNNATLLEIQITGGGAEFTLRNGEQATGFIYTGGDLHDQQINLIGPGSLEGQDFPITEVDPAAIDKIVDGVQSQSGTSDTKITVMRLTKQNVTGGLEWIINAEGGGRTGLVYNADPDGSNVTSPLGTGVIGKGTATSPPTTTPTTGGSANTATAPNGKTPQEIVQCIQEAAGDAQKIQACTQ